MDALGLHQPVVESAQRLDCCGVHAEVDERDEVREQRSGQAETGRQVAIVGLHLIGGEPHRRPNDDEAEYDAAHTDPEDERRVP